MGDERESAPSLPVVRYRIPDLVQGSECIRPGFTGVPQAVSRDTVLIAERAGHPWLWQWVNAADLDRLAVGLR